jgi:hypothetical protein
VNGPDRGPAMIRVKDAVVARVFQAQCRVPGCDWRGAVNGGQS